MLCGKKCHSFLAGSIRIFAKNRGRSADVDGNGEGKRLIRVSAYTLVASFFFEKPARKVL
jgi:hypothetical protein